MTSLRLTAPSILGPLQVSIIDAATGGRAGSLIVSSAHASAELEIDAGDYIIHASSQRFGSADYPVKVGRDGDGAKVDLRETDFYVPAALSSGLTPLSSVPWSRRPRSRKSVDAFVVVGQLKGGDWRAKRVEPSRATSRGLRIEISGGLRPIAAGFMNDEGTGRFVICPPFKDGIEVTLLYDPSGVSSADLDASPADRLLADLAQCLSASSFTGFGEYWNDCRAVWGRDTIGHHLGRRDTGGALLCAFAIDRFDLDDALDEYLPSLEALLPSCADVHLLRASRIAKGMIEGTEADVISALDQANDRQLLLARSHRLALELSAVFLGRQSLRPTEVGAVPSGGFITQLGRFSDNSILLAE